MAPSFQQIVRKNWQSRVRSPANGINYFRCLKLHESDELQWKLKFSISTTVPTNTLFLQFEYSFI